MQSSSQMAYRNEPFQLRGSSFTMMVLKVTDPNDPTFFDALQGKVAQAPNFFRNAPVVLDLDELPPGAAFDFRAFAELLARVGLVLVGLQGGTRELQDGVLAAGYAVVPPARAAKPEAPRVVEAAPQVDAPAAEAPELPYQKSTMIVAETIRSGRQIYAQGGDLVVIGSVSPGAELLADGSIHVYGALRGRALAGIAGDRGARIFCQSLEAEMVSISGLYRVSEDLEKAVLRRQAQVFLDPATGYLRIDPVAG